MSLPDYSKWRVECAEDAVKMIRAQIERVAGRHNATFIPIPDATHEMRREQKNQHMMLLYETGIAIGLIEMAHKSAKLSDAGYKELRNETLKYTMPGVVGVVGSF